MVHEDEPKCFIGQVPELSLICIACAKMLKKKRKS